MTLNRSISGQAPWGHYGMTVWEYQRARSRVGARDDSIEPLRDDISGVLRDDTSGVLRNDSFLTSS